jgi:hypothetical protein
MAGLAGVTAIEVSVAGGGVSSFTLHDESRVANTMITIAKPDPFLMICSSSLPQDLKVIFQVLQTGSPANDRTHLPQV